MVDEHVGSSDTSDDIVRTPRIRWLLKFAAVIVFAAAVSIIYGIIKMRIENAKMIDPSSNIDTIMVTDAVELTDAIAITNDEDVTFDLDSVSNSVSLSSKTGVSSVDLSNKETRE